MRDRATGLQGPGDRGDESGEGEEELAGPFSDNAVKLVRMPTEKSGDIWVIVHDLVLQKASLSNSRPIHFFTYLAQTIHLSNAGKKRIFHLCLALENKLYAVRHHHFEFQKAIAEWNNIFYQDKYLRDYGSQQKVISVLEALLNAIYSALEIVAGINKILSPTLPEGFRRQTKKDAFFNINKWNWLCEYYDLRTEYEHYGTCLPQMSANSIILEITRSKNNFVLKQGRWRLPFKSILSYSVCLFNMVDQWALKELSRVDPEAKLDSLNRLFLDSPLVGEKIRAGDILKLLSEKDAGK